VPLALVVMLSHHLFAEIKIPRNKIGRASGTGYDVGTSPFSLGLKSRATISVVPLALVVMFAHHPKCL